MPLARERFTGPHPVGVVVVVGDDQLVGIGGVPESFEVVGNPDGWWTRQQIRNLVMDLGDRVDEFRFLVRDRTGQFAASFDAVLADVGITTVKIPPRCPWANCHAERFALTARAELTEYVRHYDGRRLHRSRELRPPRPTHPVAKLASQRIKRQRLFGGLINEYERAP